MLLLRHHGSTADAQVHDPRLSQILSSSFADRRLPAFRYKANGYKNVADAPLPDYTSDADIDALASLDLKVSPSLELLNISFSSSALTKKPSQRTRGIVNIPVCNLQNLVDTSMDTENLAGNVNWPCP